jgi:flagellar motor switch/type III secretory pathway protein FliN
MATTPQIPPSVSVAAPAAAVSAPSANATATSEQALVPVLTEPSEEQDDFHGVTGAAALLPIELDVAVPVRNFRVRNLLALEPGQLIESQWHNGDDVPLASGEIQLAWSEFEVIEQDLAVRITRLP